MANQATVVEAAAEAAEETILSRIERSSIDDLDVTVRFDGEDFSVDIYLTADIPDDRLDRIAEDAATAAGLAAEDAMAGAVENDY